MRSIQLRRLIPSVKERWTRIEAAIDLRADMMSPATKEEILRAVPKLCRFQRGRPIGHGLVFIEDSHHPARKESS